MSFLRMGPIGSLVSPGPANDKVMLGTYSLSLYSKIYDCFEANLKSTTNIPTTVFQLCCTTSGARTIFRLAGLN